MCWLPPTPTTSDSDAVCRFVDDECVTSRTVRSHDRQSYSRAWVKWASQEMVPSRCHRRRSGRPSTDTATRLATPSVASGGGGGSPHKFQSLLLPSDE